MFVDLPRRLTVNVCDDKQQRIFDFMSQCSAQSKPSKPSTSPFGRSCATSKRRGSPGYQFPQTIRVVSDNEQEISTFEHVVFPLVRFALLLLSREGSRGSGYLLVLALARLGDNLSCALTVSARGGEGDERLIVPHRPLSPPMPLPKISTSPLNV